MARVLLWRVPSSSNPLLTRFRYSNPEYYDNELVEPDDFGSLTAIILKARFYAKYPDGCEVTSDFCDYKKGDRLDFDEAIESSGDDIVEAVWGEWADMGAEAFNAQKELLAALERQHWGEDDWDKYREQQAQAQERELARSDRMKLEAAAMTASRQAMGLKYLRPMS